MKIYFAYRSGYIYNNRHVRTFEAASVLDWFVGNWELLCSQEAKAIENFLGAHPYGLPVTNYQEQKSVEAPRNLRDLKDKLENFVYSNQVLVKKNCVQVFTDDDEIELAWYVFDEIYAAQNPENLSLWLYDDLPTEFVAEPDTEILPAKIVPLHGAARGHTYYLSSMIYDSSHLSDLEGAYLIEGVSVPDLVDFLRTHELATTTNRLSYGLHEIRFLQQLCKILPNSDQEQIFNELARFPSTSLDEIPNEEIANLTPEQIKASQMTDSATHLSQANLSEHFVELWSCNGDFFSYLVIFDDFWLHKNRDLGRSLNRFCKTWKI